MPPRTRCALARLVALLRLAPTPSFLHAQAATPSPARLTTSVDTAVRTDVLGRGVTGVSIVVARGTGTLLERSWGFADVTAQRPADASATYRIGSMGKQFTAALLLEQVDRGRLSLNDTIGRIVLGRPPAPKPVPMAPTVALAGTPATATVGAEARRQFVGDYETAPGIVFGVTSEDGSFYVTPPRGARQLLVHESGATDAVGRTGATTTFLVDAGGQGVGMLTRQHGAERHLRKIK